MPTSEVSFPSVQEASCAVTLFSGLSEICSCHSFTPSGPPFPQAPNHPRSMMLSSRRDSRGGVNEVELRSPPHALLESPAREVLNLEDFDDLRAHQAVV
ncbi:hypothetical protein FQA47_016820 [Oryzias melastigma]|uniref:Uncharacterized protein n=1 Tax=Oryzias melastigma TaxID=30732 RepID=A0A834C5S7_ORYME|nr:hypothetical protein FQA47_016820 [Oryzias melastigma]